MSFPVYWVYNLVKTRELKTRQMSLNKKQIKKTIKEKIKDQVIEKVICILEHNRKTSSSGQMVPLGDTATGCPVTLRNTSCPVLRCSDLVNIKALHFFISIYDGDITTHFG